MMVIFPFEEHFYRARKVDAAFVGHPLAQLPLPSSTREEFASRHNLDPAKNWVALLPGSRRKEIQLNLPEMLGAAAALNSSGEHEFILPVASTVDASYLRSFFKDSQLKITLVDDAREALHHARVGVVASGTATVQATVIGNPFVVVYRVSPLTFAVAKQLIRYPSEIPAQIDEHGNLPIAMVNLIAGRRIVPELLQSRFTAANVAETLVPLLSDTPTRQRMVDDLAETGNRLHSSAPVGPIATVCDAVEALLNQSSPTSGRISTGSV
jgi:lipid-A-disaccharide synthase